MMHTQTFKTMIEALNYIGGKGQVVRMPDGGFQAYFG